MFAAVPWAAANVFQPRIISTDVDALTMMMIAQIMAYATASICGDMV